MTRPLATIRLAAKYLQCKTPYRSTILVGLLFAASAYGQKPAGVLPPKHCVLISPTLCRAVQDPPVAILLGVHTGLIIKDGSQTNHLITHHDFNEGDPISEFFIGEHPTWSRMAPVGIAWVIGETYLAERMRRAKNPVVRKLAWLPQTFGIASSVSGVAHNARVAPNY